MKKIYNVTLVDQNLKEIIKLPMSEDENILNFARGEEFRDFPLAQSLRLLLMKIMVSFPFLIKPPFEKPLTSLYMKLGYKKVGKPYAVNLPYQPTCRVGACPTCVGKVLVGSVDQSNQRFLDDDQIESGYAILCATYPMSNCTIMINQEDNLY